MLFKRSFFLALVLICCIGAACAVPLPREAAELCLERGRSSRIFPDGTTADDLLTETYSVRALDESYTVWVVSTQNQRPDVEFGWISIYAPTNTILQSSRTRSSYEDAIRMLAWEQTYGCSYFWPAELKARYYHELHGSESRITYPNGNEITEAEATAIARRTLMEDAGLSEKLLDQLPVSAEFYQDDTPDDSVQASRCWGITFRDNNVLSHFKPVYAVVIDGLSGIAEYSIDYEKSLIIEHVK